MTESIDTYCDFYLNPIPKAYQPRDVAYVCEFVTPKADSPASDDQRRRRS